MATDRGQWALQGGTTGLTMIPPTGHAQGDRHVLWAINKLEDKVPVISGLSPLASAVVGLVAAPAADVGQQRITVWEFDEGASQGNVTITITGALNSLGGGYGVTPAAGEVFKPSTVLTASDVSSGTAFAALMASNQGFALTDRIVQIATFTHGNPGLPGRGITLPGCTLNAGGSTGVNSAPQNTTGNHQYTYTDVGTVTAGAQSAAATAVGTTTTATTGGAAHVRMSYTKTAVLGQATETDAAQPVARQKSRVLLWATEADAALTLLRRKSRSLGIGVETSAAQAVGRWKTRLIGPAFESDDPRPIGRTKVRAVGIAGETETAEPISRSKVRHIGTAGDLSEASTIGRTHYRAITAAAEVDTARPLVAVKQRAIGVANESDLAVSLLPPVVPTEPVLAATNAPSSDLTATHPRPTLTSSHAPSSQLEVSHGV